MLQRSVSFPLTAFEDWAKLFMWFLGLQTQVLKLTQQQVLYQASHFPSHLVFSLGLCNPRNWAQGLDVLRKHSTCELNPSPFPVLVKYWNHGDLGTFETCFSSDFLFYALSKSSGCCLQNKVLLRTHVKKKKKKKVSGSTRWLSR